MQQASACLAASTLIAWILVQPSQCDAVTPLLPTTKLLPSDGGPFDNFGFSVGLSGTTAVVGAWTDDDNGNNSGSAYVYDIETGNELHKLTPDNADADDTFGYSAAIENETVVVGAWRGDGQTSDSGAAYVLDARTGIQQLTLVADDGISECFRATSKSPRSIALTAGRIAP